jgi:hypothetical protein
MQSHEGPASTGGLVRRFGGTPRVSAMHTPAARSTTQPPGSQAPAGAGIRAGFRVHWRATQRHAPGGGDDLSQPAGSARPPTQRRGAQASSHRQSASAAQAAPTLGSAAALEAGAVGTLETAAADAPGVRAGAADSLALVAEAAFGAGVSPAEGGPGVAQAARSASAGAARSMTEAY